MVLTVEFVKNWKAKVDMEWPESLHINSFGIRLESEINIVSILFKRSLSDSVKNMVVGSSTLDDFCVFFWRMISVSGEYEHSIPLFWHFWQCGFPSSHYTWCQLNSLLEESPIFHTFTLLLLQVKHPPLDFLWARRAWNSLFFFSGTEIRKTVWRCLASGVLSSDEPTSCVLWLAEELLLDILPL